MTVGGRDFFIPLPLLPILSVFSPLQSLPSFLCSPPSVVTIPPPRVFSLSPFPCPCPHSLNPTRRSWSGGAVSSLGRSGRSPAARRFSAFLGWNLRNFCHWHNDKYVILLHILLSNNDITKFQWVRLEGIARTTFWPWGRSPPSPPWSRRLCVYLTAAISCVGVTCSQFDTQRVFVYLLLRCSEKMPRTRCYTGKLYGRTKCHWRGQLFKDNSH